MVDNADTATQEKSVQQSLLVKKLLKSVMYNVKVNFTILKYGVNFNLTSQNLVMDLRHNRKLNTYSINVDI